HVVQNLTELENKFADKWPRDLALLDHYWRKGYNTKAKLEALLKGEDETAHFRRRSIAHEANRVMVDFSKAQTKLDRKLAKIMPFYGWTRGSASQIAGMPLHTPGRALAYSQIGRQGSKEWQKLWDQLPEYMKGVFQSHGYMVNPSSIDPAGTFRQ